MLNCKFYDETGTIDVTKENIGYDYRDVIVPAEKKTIQYLARN